MQQAEERAWQGLARLTSRAGRIRSLRAVDESRHGDGQTDGHEQDHGGQEGEMAFQSGAALPPRSISAEVITVNRVR